MKNACIELSLVALVAATTIACGDSDDSGQGGNATTTTSNGGSGGGGGAEPTADWSCLGSVAAPTYGSSTVTINYTITEILDMTPLAGITLDVCEIDEPTCATPILSGVSAADGTLALDQPNDRPLVGRATGPGIPIHYGFSYGGAETSVDFNYPLLSNTSVDALIAVTGATADPTRGHLGVSVNDCAGTPAPGASIEVSTADGDTIIGYINESVLPEPSLGQTTSAGTIFVVNLPAGPFTVTVTDADSGDMITERTGEAFAGGITYVWPASPTPEG